MYVVDDAHDDNDEDEDENNNDDDDDDNNDEEEIMMMMIFFWLPCNTNAMYSLAMWPMQIATVGWYHHCKCTVANMLTAAA